MSWYKGGPVKVPGEVIYEVVTGEDGQEFGVAIADVIEAQPHHHDKTHETYVLIAGEIEVNIDGVSHKLTKPGESIEIPLGKVHFGKSLGDKPARIAAITTPPWSSEDHHLDI
jgi:mannose-6-phosphate isomerase-like protein (cupin superfamily)